MLVHTPLTAAQRKKIETACKITREGFSEFADRTLYKLQYEKISSITFHFQEEAVPSMDEAIAFRISTGNNRFLMRICNSTDARFTKQQVLRALLLPEAEAIIKEAEEKQKVNERNRV